MLREDNQNESTAAIVFRGDYARVTAADRPGIAQPVPLREVPQQPWGRVLLGAFALFAMLLGGWEWYWRDFGATPGTRNTDALWAIQRRRIDEGEGGATVAIGSSRMFFDLQLDVWQKLDGKRPIQLAFEGTTPLPFLEDLAADPKFTGRLLVGVAPQLFFSGFARHREALTYLHKESPSQRAGQWLSMHVIEPYFAFYEPDYALDTVLKRQPWPLRPGLNDFMAVRKLSESAPDRSTHLWSKVETDPYRQVARKVWLNHLAPRDDMPPPEKLKQNLEDQIDRAAKAVKTLQARGVKVLFVRPPSTGPYLEWETKVFPRERTWDVLLAKSGAPGIHFQDYPELNQAWNLPEWSHLAHADANRFTEALYSVIQREHPGFLAAPPGH